MKAILEFNLPEDREEFEACQKASTYLSALYEIRNEVFRPARKHGYTGLSARYLNEHLNSEQLEIEVLTSTIISVLEDRFNEILNNNNIDDI